MRLLQGPRPAAVAVAQCFGCGAGNPAGLRLDLDGQRDGWVIGAWTSGRHHAGADGALSRGVQATLLECAAVAATAWRERAPDAAAVSCLELHVLYRRPAPIGARLTVAARVEKVQDGRHRVIAELAAGPGDVCAKAWALCRLPG